MYRMMKKILHVLRTPERLECQSRVAAAYARAAATAAAREVDPTRPLSWEFSGFSQHGEDGIIDYLCARMLERNRFFMEIGSADGLQNCSAWLAFARRYGGVMVEGNPRLTARCKRVIRELRCHNVSAVQELVDRDNIEKLMKRCPYRNPDVFILDIDGIDYHILEAVLSLGFSPGIVVVEYNSAFGPERAITVPYDPGFSRMAAHPTRLYYGASLEAWHALLGSRGYRFVTVDSNGVNAFFIHPRRFQDGFADSLEGLAFQDNLSDRNGATEDVRRAGDWCTPLRDWKSQFELIRDLNYVDVSQGGVP
ncbi:MAG: hypothetical protein JNK74_14525 [Candidatus Hydrogenedentes bacterium]|nr:hypothetical protein [Candidatus Hydrogenedentota bacterium]